MSHCQGKQTTTVGHSVEHSIKLALEDDFPQRYRSALGDSKPASSAQVYYTKRDGQVCHYCGLSGHYERDCHIKDNGLPKGDYAEHSPGDINPDRKDKRNEKNKEKKEERKRVMALGKETAARDLTCTGRVPASSWTACNNWTKVTESSESSTYRLVPSFDSS